MQGSKFYRGIRASTSGQATAKLVRPQTASASSPTPKTGTSVVPSGGNRLPVASSGTGASNLPAVKGGSVTATQGASKAGSGFSYSRLGDTAINTAKSKGFASMARSIATKAAGRAAGVLGLAVPDSTKTEPGNPVFRKTDTGKTSVAGYRSSTTPRATDTNTQKGMVGSLSRRGGLAPSVKNQELPSKIAPVKTAEKGTLSAPAPKPAAAPAAAPKTFGQAFAAARKEAGSGKGQFEFGGKKYQTNIAPAKGAEKYIAPSTQKATSVGKSPTPSTSSVPSVSKPATSTTPALPTAADRKGLAQSSIMPFSTVKATPGSLSPTPVKNQDTGMTPAELPKVNKVNIPFSDTFAGNPEKTPVPATTAPSTSPTIPGSTAPRSGTSDTGGFMPGKPTTSTPDVKASVSAAPEPEKKPETSTPSYSPDSPAGKAWANRGKFGTQQEDKKMVAESFVTVGDNKYRIV